MCGTIATQKKGILDTIEKLNLVNGSVLACTFCKSRVPNKVHEHEKKLFINNVNILTEQKGFRCKRIDNNNFNYSGKHIFKRSRECHMDVLMFVLKY